MTLGYHIYKGKENKYFSEEIACKNLLKEKVGPRQQDRKSLNHTHPTYTLNLHLHREQFILRKN